MKITVKIIPNSKETKVEEISPNSFKINLKSPAKENRANEELVKILSGYLAVTKSSISIKIGKTSRNKVIEISS